MLEKIMRNLLEFVVYFCLLIECIRGWVGRGGFMGAVFGFPSYEQNRFGTYWQTIVNIPEYSYHFIFDFFTAKEETGYDFSSV